MNNVTEIFGSLVFNDTVMKERLSEDIYQNLRNTIDNGEPMSLDTANAVANAMKDWAIEKGATHFTHWFQPMTDVTAEKHDSFISPSEDGKIIMEFSGKELIKGEPDASSFPSGGLRATFEARGYTAWDPSSYAFIKDNSLYIPTAFCSYGGEALDKKTPLLRSMETIEREALRILRLFGNTDSKKVIATVGAEQEYFLVDKQTHDKRKDLIFTGRTLFGAKPPKGQELGDHYFGQIKPRVSAYMKELDEELWKRGVLAKTKHNEAAPAQHELAPVFTTANISIDHNQLTMELMKKIAAKHDLVCLLHEKPFDGVNGSGKHNNWSLTTDDGINLLKPGKTPYDNLQFLIFFCAVIKAVDEYQDLLRISIASAANDHRLGGHEAPPAIVSIFIGEQLEAILEAYEHDDAYLEKKKEKMEIGAHVIPTFTKDKTDRNRTSPFAFTGNKFEFRMLGSSASVSEPNVVLNTIVAEELSRFAELLEASVSFDDTVHKIVRDTVKQHKRIIFNGNNYSDEWVEEARSRGLSNYKTTPEAIPHFTDKRNIELYTKHAIYTETEMHSRCEILLENYANIINIEALTLLEMVKKEIIPSVFKYIKELSDVANSKRTFSKTLKTDVELELAGLLSDNICKLNDLTQTLEENLENAKLISDNAEKYANFYHDNVLCIMEEARGVINTLEAATASSYWPYPTYSELLFNV